MSSHLTLYFAKGSPPSQACLLLARHLKLDIEVKHINLLTGEQHSEEFLKLNPLNKVPVLVDGDFVLSESRAILAYLVNTRNAGSDLYPTDLKTRALIDQRLYFDATVVFQKLGALVVSSSIYESVQLANRVHARLQESIMARRKLIKSREMVFEQF